ncbi:hypothetical protein KBX19_11175 [Corynebacterium sp. CCUG 71335]|uniref:hypothetical protein n=1 Tax=unclassified Corynebacterium TaxID=2624378 RepID=UPI002108E54D|nr:MULTISPECIES: hypothetical protein [unclassified Corynebacterium]MCQ4621765.1 hypothetical protein [Corynebacterium sp. CCUG 71335]MCQ4623704.1 hypothetical protein [Corynebacterium sp. CCUG 70398]
MTHHNSNAAPPHRCTEEKKTTTPRTNKEVLLSLDVFFNRDELVTMNRFLRRHADSVRVVGADGEHVHLDVFQAMKFLTTLVKYSDQDNGMITLEADANPRHLTYYERDNLVAADQFDPKELEAGDAPKEDAPRELLDAMFCQDTWEVWTAEAIDFLARCNDFEEARRITQSFRDEGVPAQLSRTIRTVYPV